MDEKDQNEEEKSSEELYQELMTFLDDNRDLVHWILEAPTTGNDVPAEDEDEPSGELFVGQGARA